MRARKSRSIPVAVAVATAALLVSGCGALGADDEVLRFEHGPLTPELVDLGAAGPSVGDQRIFHGDGSMDGTGGQLDGVMVTTAAEDGVETRVTTLVLTLTDSPEDQIIFTGTAQYAAGSATFDPGDTVTRPVVGGSGAYNGAQGYVVSTHAEDDSWVHEFHVTVSS